MVIHANTRSSVILGLLWTVYLHLLIHFVHSYLLGNFGYCNYFLSTVCFYKVQQTLFQYICKNIHVCSIPLGIHCLEAMEATVYSWVSWKACSFCKYCNSVNVVIFKFVQIKNSLKHRLEKSKVFIFEIQIESCHRKTWQP